MYVKYANIVYAFNIILNYAVNNNVLRHLDLEEV